MREQVKDFSSAVIQVVRRWQRQIDGNFGRSETTKQAQELMAAYKDDLLGYETDPHRLLRSYRGFREWYFEHRSDKNPRWYEFLGYLARRKEERQEQLQASSTTPTPYCEICGGGMQWFPVYLPACDGEPDPTMKNFIPGQPWNGPVVRDTLPCKCNKPQSSGQWKWLRDRYVSWFKACRRGEWDLHPGREMQPEDTLAHFYRRIRDDNWEPEEPSDD